jgi:hypothetical protein
VRALDDEFAGRACDTTNDGLIAGADDPALVIELFEQPGFELGIDWMRPCRDVGARARA